MGQHFLQAISDGSVNNWLKGWTFVNKEGRSRGEGSRIQQIMGSQYRAQGPIDEQWDLNKMMGGSVLQSLSPSKEDMHSWMTEDNILSKEMFSRIKLEEPHYTFSEMQRISARRHLYTGGRGSSKMLQVVEINANILIEELTGILFV